MTEPQLQDLLDMAYEFESLITLALSRQGAPDRIHSLIEAKAYAIADAAAAHAGAGKGAVQDNEPEEIPLAEPSMRTLERESMQEAKSEEFYPTPTPEPAEPESISEPEPTPASKAEVHPRPADQPKPSAPSQPAPQPQPTKGRALRTYFALNDKYRFRRELFGNDGESMSAAIEALAQLRNLTEAEDYVYSRLGLDPDSDATREFIEVITPYYA